MTTTESAIAHLLLKEEISEFLYQEAELLDDRHFADWLDLLADDIRYWMPMRRNVKSNEMDREGYVANSPQRCYFCKTELYTELTALADKEGIEWVVNGANTDDIGDYRPGMVAASEHRVRSPLLEAGLTKVDVRAIARSLDIPIWDKPAQPCLSSRVPYGIPVTVENLSKIEQAEDYLRGLGLREVRARHHDCLCRIEVGEDEIDFAFGHRKEIVAAIKKIGYLWVSLDMSGLRSGSLNDQLNLTETVLKA